MYCAIDFEMKSAAKHLCAWLWIGMRLTRTIHEAIFHMFLKYFNSLERY